MYETILVGTDGSESANEAVEEAIYLAEQTGGNLHAVTVVNTARYGEPALSSTELVITELEDRAHDQLEIIEERAEESGIHCETKCFHGEPSTQLLEYADEHDADLIVLGYQGRTHTGKIGSTADRVSRGTDRTVMLV